MHKGISREEAEELLSRHGATDGLYLVRAPAGTQEHAFVLSLCAAKKV